MDRSELAQYFDGQKGILMMNSATFIDYDLIENPIKSIQKGFIEFFPHVSYLEQIRIFLTMNKFSDKT